MPADWKELGRKGVRGGDVGREAVALVEPVSLAEFADDVVALVLSAEDQLTHVADLRDELLPSAPVSFDQCVEVEREWLGSGKLAEIEFRFGEGATVDNLFVGAGFGSC